MLGISISEFFVVFIVLILFFDAKDVVRILAFIYGIYVKVRDFLNKLLKEFNQLSVLSKFDNLIDQDKNYYDPKDKR